MFKMYTYLHIHQLHNLIHYKKGQWFRKRFFVENRTLRGRFSKFSFFESYKGKTDEKYREIYEKMVYEAIIKWIEIQIIFDSFWSNDRHLKIWNLSSKSIETLNDAQVFILAITNHL